MTLVPTTKGKIMTSRYSDDRQGRTPDFVGARFSSPLFYSDAHARHLLSFGPRYVNVFTYRAGVPGAETRHIPSSAHHSRDIAGRDPRHPSYGRAAYRIVVKPKRVSV
jgi:hypothetical protein